MKLKLNSIFYFPFAVFIILFSLFQHFIRATPITTSIESTQLVQPRSVLNLNENKLNYLNRRQFVSSGYYDEFGPYQPYFYDPYYGFYDYENYESAEFEDFYNDLPYYYPYSSRIHHRRRRRHHAKPTAINKSYKHNKRAPSSLVGMLLKKPEDLVDYGDDDDDDDLLWDVVDETDDDLLWETDEDDLLWDEDDDDDEEDETEIEEIDISKRDLKLSDKENSTPTATLKRRQFFNDLDFVDDDLGWIYYDDYDNLMDYYYLYEEPILDEYYYYEPTWDEDYYYDDIIDEPELVYEDIVPDVFEEYYVPFDEEEFIFEEDY
ncbi:hypothetical protein G9A89_013806 [Geosiphon pyriformis]|nr:hypothetical protein G9A89_013806 [Geosiphon pyriformis]